MVGCQADRVRRACGHGVTYVENPQYAQTNSMYSLWMARPLLYEGFVVLNCDVLFHPVLLDDLLTAHHGNALLLAYREADQPLFGDEEMKVKVRCGRVTDMSKTMDPAEADGENLGIVKFGPEGAAALVDIMDRLIDAGGVRDWAPRAFAEFARTHPLHAIGTRGLPWIEIDFPEDYERAVRDVLPLIDAEHVDPSAPRVGRPNRAAHGIRTALERARIPTDGPAHLCRRVMRPTAVSVRVRRGDGFPQLGARRVEAAPPRVVALGGGTGLAQRAPRPPAAALRRGRACTRVRAARPPRRDRRDLRRRRELGETAREFNIIPPGDIRNCLAALSDNHALIADIFQYRFGAGDGLNGHTLGNLVLTALADVMNDFPRAVEIAARVVGALGTVLPATSEIVTLVAEFEDGRVLSGETAIAAAGGRIARVSLIPERPALPPGNLRRHRAARTSSSPAREASSRAFCRRCSSRRSPRRSAGRTPYGCSSPT